MPPVKLYVYDLSNGLARQLSRQLTGKQIDGIWHTSVVVFAKEIFYGDGILTAVPGQSHHGQPLQIIDMGETAIDEETFNEYLAEIRQQYTGDKYHLLDFNCNSFTNDVVGFLTGGSIPAWIKDLPSDFLSTPFGAMLRPTIDAMFRPGGAGRAAPPTAQATASAAAAAAASPDPQLAATLIRAFANRATQSAGPSGPSHPSAATASVSAPLQICANPASFATLLRTHRALVAFFTSATCPPCRAIEPVFEALAQEKTAGRAGAAAPAFVKIDLGVGMGSQVGAQYGVRVTPTFIFFLDGKKVEEMKGANAQELRAQVDLLLFSAFPPHPHQSLSLPAIEAISLNPILFSQVPVLATVLAKFLSFVSAAAAASPGAFDQSAVEQTLSTSVVPYLESRIAAVTAPAGSSRPLTATPGLLTAWTQMTATLAQHLPTAQLFPLADMWRLAVLDPAVVTWLAAQPPHTLSPLDTLLGAASAALVIDGARNTALLTLRLLTNALKADVLARRLCAAGGAGRRVLDVLVPALLHADAPVRTAAASVAFNAAAFLQRGRVERVRRGLGGAGGTEGGGEEVDGDWEVEMVCAVVEAIGRERASEDVVHRLTASLACLLRLSPIYEEQLAPLLEVLQAKETLEAKLLPGGCGENGVQKKEVKKLVQEVATKLCP